jgi:acid stress-induced BolA-like protein IbaG/YrbA
MSKSHDQIKTELAQHLRQFFPHDTIDVSDGYGSNIHILVVTKNFDNMTNSQQQDHIWDIIRQSNLEEHELQKISLALTIPPKMLK